MCVCDTVSICVHDNFFSFFMYIYIYTHNNVCVCVYIMQNISRMLAGVREVNHLCLK